MAAFIIYQNAAAFTEFRTKNKIQLQPAETIKKEFNIKRCVKIQNQHILILIHAVDSDFGITEFRDLIENEIVSHNAIKELIIVIPLDNISNVKKYLSHAREVLKIPHIFVVGHLFFAQNIMNRPDKVTLRILPPEEIQAKREFFRNPNWEKTIMKIMESDVAARWYGVYRGNVVEASAPSINAIECITYHLVE